MCWKKKKLRPKWTEEEDELLDELVQEFRRENNGFMRYDDQFWLEIEEEFNAYFEDFNEDREMQFINTGNNRTAKELERRHYKLLKPRPEPKN